MTAAWTLLAVQLTTGTILDELPYADLGVGDTLGRAGRLTATLPGHDPRITASTVEPAGTLLVADRDGVIVGHGIAYDDEWTDGQVRAGGEGLWSALRDDRRTIRDTHTYSAVEQFAIVEDLLAYAQAQPYGNLGLQVLRNPTSTGIARTITWEAYERKSIAEAVEDLAEADNGFEHRTFCAWTGGQIGRYLDLWYPQLGRTTDIVWEHGHSAKIARRTRAGSRAANRVDAIGAGTGAAKLIGTAAATPAGIPRYDGTVTRTDIDSQPLLDDLAAAELARRQTAADTISLQLLDTTTWPPGSWIAGDTVWVVADDGALRVDGAYRIVSWDATVDDLGGETVTVDLAANTTPGRPLLPPADWAAATRRELERRVATLERR